MELSELEKRLVFQIESTNSAAALNELYMIGRYAPGPAEREAAQTLVQKLRSVSDHECMAVINDIQRNYRLPYPARTIGEKLAEARQKSGAEKLKGHDIMGLERFADDTRHMIIFEVISNDSPIGYKGDKMRLFLTDAGYKKAKENQEQGFISIKNHAKVVRGHLHYEHKDREL